MMMTRRGFLRFLRRAALLGLATGTYGVVIEAGFRLNVTAYAFTPPRWTPGLKLRVVVLADPHMSEPHMSLTRWRHIIKLSNELKPDLILFLGDYLASHPFVTRRVDIRDVASAMLEAKATLGTFAIDGNHEWWQDEEAQRTQSTALPAVMRALETAGVPLLTNRAARLTKDGFPFWVSGTSSTVAIKLQRYHFLSRARLDDTMAQITDDAPVIHLAHEPDLFLEIPERVSLTLSGHTHGGQVRILGYSPVVNSAYGNRFAYGHIVEDGRHLIVSGGLGNSQFPIRIGMPPEIVLLDLG